MQNPNPIKITIEGPENARVINVTQIVSTAIKKMMSQSDCVIAINYAHKKHPASEFADIVINVL
jgi:hypothetical protein